jgi:hypothetical protein
MTSIGSTETRSKEFFVRLSYEELELLEHFLYSCASLGDIIDHKDPFWMMLDIRLFRNKRDI